MPPRTAIQARRSLGANPVPSRSGGSYGGGEDFGSPFKDEDNKYTPPGSSDEGNVDYGGGGSSGDQGDDNKGGASTVIPKTEAPPKKKFTIQDTFDFFAKFSPTLAIGKGFGVGIEKLFGTKPKANQFTNPNDLAIIRSLFTNKKGEVDTDKLDDYYNAYKTTIDEGMGIGAFKDADGMGLSEAAKQGLTFEDIIMGASPTGLQGSEAQRRLNPEAYYDMDLYKELEQPEDMANYPEFLANMGLKPMSSRFANTTGNLVDKANIDVNTPGLSREFKEEIFNARMELDRMGRDRSGNPQGGTNQGGGGGFVPPAITPDDPMIPQDPTLPPGVTPPTTTPKYPGSVVTDYTQLGLPQIYGNPQMPNYATFNRAGSMPVGLQDYLDNLRKRFGIG
jgi:hypothetical protein